MTTIEDVEQALEPVRQTLAMDGGDLKVESADDASVVVRLLFRDDACMDCIVPGPTLKLIVEDTLRTADVSQELTVIDPRTPEGSGD